MNEDDFKTRFKGSFTSALRWHNLDALWEVVKADADGGWFLYAIGQTVPQSPSSAEEVNAMVTELDALLRAEHNEDYCGIVYADDLNAPSMIKIYDPNNLGVVCGFSDNPPLPGWVMSKIQPDDLEADRVIPGNRKRWWNKLFSTT